MGRDTSAAEDWICRLLFADDEHILREGVSSRVNWGDIGFELVGALTNGLEVSRVVSDRYPDVMVLLLKPITAAGGEDREPL